jgi:hypothetical protein
VEKTIVKFFALSVPLFFAGGSSPAGGFSLAVPYPPAVITSVAHDADGSVSLSFLGSSNSTNVIKATSNLVPPTAWSDVSTNAASSGGVRQFTEPHATNATRFNRSNAPAH